MYRLKNCFLRVNASCQLMKVNKETNATAYTANVQMLWYNKDETGYQTFLYNISALNYWLINTFNDASFLKTNKIRSWRLKICSISEAR